VSEIRSSVHLLILWAFVVAVSSVAGTLLSSAVVSCRPSLAGLVAGRAVTCTYFGQINELLAVRVSSRSGACLSAFPDNNF